MITLCVPIITILLLYIHAESTVRDQIYMSGENTLNQYYAAVDTIVEEMGDLCLAMVMEEECGRYATYANYQTKKAAYQAIIVSNALDIFWEERYFDVFVYYPYQDRIISAKNASSSSWHYYNSYYGNTTVLGNASEDWEKFQDIISCDSASPVFSTIQKNGKTYLCAAASQWKYEGERFDYTVVAVLNADFLEKLMGIDEVNANISMMMFDHEKELILATKEELMEDYSLDGYVPGQDRYETEINGHDYMLYVRGSNNLNGYYTIALPQDSFWESLTRLRTTMGLGIVCSIVFSVLIALRGGSRSWKPIEKTLKRLTNDMEYHDINAANELEYIELMFQRENEKNQLMRGKMKMGEILQQEKQIMSLLDGSAIKADASGKDSSLSFRYDSFYVCSLAAEKNGALDAGLLSFIMRNVWEELCSQIGCGYVVTFSENRGVLLINCPTEQEENALRKLLLEGKEFIEKHYQVTITMGISDLQTGVEAVPCAYDEAEKALDYRYLAGAGKMIAYKDIKNREFQYESFEGKNLSALLMEYVHEKKQLKTSAEFINEIFELYGIHQGISLDTMECFRFEILNAVHHVMLSCQYAQEQKKENLESLLLTSDMVAFRECLIVLLDELCRENKRKEQQKDICIQAKACIEASFGDSRLSLDVLGEEIGCSPAYLSRKFKEKYGVSIVEFITEERIKNAKLLLEETSYSVQEISEMTGYLSSSTFVKTFKKKVGVPPGAYRDISKQK